MKNIKNGTILQNRYEVLRKIGEGGMAQVYLVKDLHLGKHWALKCIDIMQDTQWRYQAFLVETDFLRFVNHRAFPMLIDSFTEQNYCCLIMEFIEGETLEEYLKRKKNMKLADANKILRDIMEALSYLHKHTPAIIYGDLKPSNIMLQQNMRGRLVDFGSAMWGEQRFLMGTPEYAAPEQVSDSTDYDIDERSDIYSVGLIYSEMLTGKKTEGIYSEDPFLPRWVREFIFRCTRINPRERFQSMDLAMEAMEKKEGIGRKKPFILQDMERVVLSEYNQIMLKNNYINNKKQTMKELYQWKKEKVNCENGKNEKNG